MRKFALILIFLGGCKGGCIAGNIDACARSCKTGGNTMESYHPQNGCKCGPKIPESTPSRP